MGLRLDRKMAAPVACMACPWIGKTEDLLLRDNHPDGSPFRCPGCNGGWCLKWIEAPTTQTFQ